MAKGEKPNGNANRLTVSDMISLALPTQTKISPQGRRVAYGVRTANWRENRYETVCWVIDLDTDQSYQVTRSGNVGQFEWLDDDSLAVAKSEGDEEFQIWVFEHLVGEGVKVTDHKHGVQSFKPFAEGIVYLANDPERQERKSRAEEYGALTYFEHEESASALYYVSLERVNAYQKQLKRLTEDEGKKLVKPVLDLSKRLAEPLKIDRFFVSPLDDALFLNCRTRDDPVYWEETSSFWLKLDAEKAMDEFIDHERSKAPDEGRDSEEDRSPGIEDWSFVGELMPIALPKGATIAAVSPQGDKLLVRHKARDNMFYTQDDLWILDQEGVGRLAADELPDQMRAISGDLDQVPMSVEWTDDGILVSHVSGTRTAIARLAESGRVDTLPLQVEGSTLSPLYEFHVSRDGRLTFVGANEERVPEVYVASRTPGSPDWEVKQLTSYGDEIADWDLGTVETVRWTSRDGAEIEGVLRKPIGFDPQKKYPLVFVVHGGPSWFSGEYALDFDDVFYYPSVQFSQRDILVLKPNYRGSIGRGQAFLELNKDNLGIGDLDDLESAIDYVDSLGYLDTSRVGCMGWSQGGYVSAFATTHSDRFTAISVGAGVSDWYTYHIANDIPDFTTHYLSGTPFKNREPYIKTAPMNKLHEAKTPTLIQHGARDQRVPVSNATELYRGLQDMGVHVELFVFPEMAHPITKPRENRAVMWQNLTWFSHHLLGDELDFFRLSTEREYEKHQETGN
jgi:dipeptidyl aminopeptidase/acylaminoacyl peptidase